MLEESLPSIWASMHRWFIPTVLFILINVVIGTISFSSSQKEEKNPKPQLSRTSSVLERLRSFNLYRLKAEEIPPVITNLEAQPTETVETLEVVEPVETVEASDSEDVGHFTRSQSDTHPTAGERPQKLPQKMLKRSVSAKSVFGHFEEELVEPAVPRPSTMRERKAIGDDEEVDARADDFINMFKHQLKLQRLDSILRNKEMLNNSK
ncbi:pathogen-associated molecular patterns-induced protein A70-like [Magnolia sinica]|uniref:pathogen-associated molecular patterns-induced protein A70-like n=1 Tax=Magnolia sinica TaxID=86752 RepID=UPI00265821CB|nr:pathogen-associated molecular patterns-induced protein A70-like [Magnolia sinica]